MSQKLYGPFFHGGTWDGAKPIKMGSGALGNGAYFSPDIDRARAYAKEKNGKVTKVYLELTNPLLVEIKTTHEHPCVTALVNLGLDKRKAEKKVEKAEEEKGYLGKEISILAIKQGYDSLMLAKDGSLLEVVIWSSNKVFTTEEID
jgi:hypothetical protein